MDGKEVLRCGKNAARRDKSREDSKAMKSTCCGPIRRGAPYKRAIQIRPSFSVAYWLLAASLAKLERLDQAKAAAAPKENQAHSQSAPD